MAKKLKEDIEDVKGETIETIETVTMEPIEFLTERIKQLEEKIALIVDAHNKGFHI